MTFVRTGAPGAAVPVGEPEVDEVSEPEVDDRVRCAQCGEAVTESALAVEHGGAHEHTFRNPAGYSWTIRCFADASGCTSAGPFTAEASWFAGYQWRYALCSTCGRHLGWWFVGSGPSFVGLIARRITGG